jgi:hypothetical protein
MITQQQLQILRAEGYSEKEIAEAMQEVEKENVLKQQYQGAKAQNVDPRSMSQQSMFSYNPNDNMIKWQLELNEILERIEHVLRGDQVKYESGQTIWIKLPESHKDRLLNDLGVQEVLRILSMYLNRNTILGNYTDEEVNDKVFDFGDRLNTLFYTKYEKIGFDTYEKRKNFEMLWGSLVDTVHSAYSRAIGGQERSSLREARQLQQLENVNAPNTVNVNNNAGAGARTRGLFNPMRYIVGKYK